MSSSFPSSRNTWQNFAPHNRAALFAIVSNTGCTSFGEREMKAFIQHTCDIAENLEQALSELDTDIKVALTHYAPVPDTLRGEPPEIYPFLGSYLLGEAIDATGTHLAVHGHAHFGTEQGMTPGGVRVRNVAQPIIRSAYTVYVLEGNHS